MLAGAMRRPAWCNFRLSEQVSLPWLGCPTSFPPDWRTRACGLAKIQLAAAIQQQVNEQIIESLSDGVLVVDERGRAANPAARALLDSDRALCDAVLRPR